MPFPAGWPPKVPQTRRSLRFYATAAATANFADNAFLFIDSASANPYAPLPVVPPGSDVSTGAAPTVVASLMGTGTASATDPKASIWSGSIRVVAGASDLEISFDGTNIHGYVRANTEVIYRDRHEAGIAVRGGGTFRVEAW